MREKDTSDVMFSTLAILTDAVGVFAGFLAATWVRFDSGLMPIRHGRPPDLYGTYAAGAALAALLFLFVFQALGLYVRPQTGRFENKVPRLVRSCGIGTLLCIVVAYALKNEVADFSSLAIAVSFPSVVFFVLLERYALYRIEWNVARHSRKNNQVLIVGTDSVAGRLQRTLEQEPMLRSKVIGFLAVDDAPADASVPGEKIKGGLGNLDSFVREHKVDQLVLTNSTMGHQRIVEILLLCERNLITFNMVPDLFRIMTSTMDVQSLNDIPLLGIGRWPLDTFWNRALKRVEDIAGSAVGLIVSAPVILVAACVIKRSSPGPVFFGQERCGEKGKTFTLYKLRTMTVNAELDTGPVFASRDDPRVTKAGTFLRRYNIDELPQLWNVLMGHMSLVGPRPERPHFVEQFREDISRYMWRHVSKPGMTGWAQVNGLRGNTSIEERVKYDLYYLENWSLALDFKILTRTLRARENAY